MKKILLFIFYFFLFFKVVLANEASSLISIVNKCAVIKDNKVIIPVKVISENKGGLTALIGEYTLGKIENKENYNEVIINNVTGKNIKNVLVNPNRDSEHKSLINFYIDKDIHTEILEEVMSFNIEVNFKKEVKSNIFILGNDVVISDSAKVCEGINGFTIEEVQKTEYIDLNKISKILNYLFIGIILVLIIVIISLKKDFIK